MAKSSNQKLKLLYLIKILSEETDETHALTSAQLIQKLAAYDIPVERKTLYADIEALNQFGYDILNEKTKDHNGYFLNSRDFELPELKLLVDAVASSKFITEKKSGELIKKLETLCSKSEGHRLHRQVYVKDRLKTDNESIYYSVDHIHEAMQNNKQISFQYFQWNGKKEMQLKHDGKRYHVSPYLLVWNDSNYYLVAYDGAANCLKHFRVDKMTNSKIEDEDRLGKDVFAEFSPAIYAKNSFQMYAGEETFVTLQCDSYLSNVMVDRFGKEISLRDMKDGTIQVRTQVMISPMFYGWIAGFGGKVKVLNPKAVVDDMLSFYKNMLTELNGETITK